jgi:uncharacterized protein with PIN domain
MLGTLAKWLRMLGFDTVFAPPIDDKELLKIAWREKRILLTRDKNIGTFKDAQVLTIVSDDLDVQLVEVVKTFNLSIEDPMSRCSLCNHPVEKVSKEECEGKVPEGVYARQKEFWRCGKCEQYYWAGSHWEKIMERIEKIRVS